MRLHTGWVLGATVAVILNGAAFADVTVSHSNDPTAALDGQMAMLLGAERQTLDALPAGKLTELAVGPKIETKTTPGRKAEAQEVTYTLNWLAAQPAPDGDSEWECLRTAIYFESRGETLEGQFAVAEVILNRRDSGIYPATICAVVRQGGNDGCQFSYVCDGMADAMRDAEAKDVAGRIARVMLDGAPRTLTRGATHFHTRTLRPGWSNHFAQTAAIGAHLFYKQP
ncbi:MAG: hypothetical protein RIT14_481 [Pseudomonadota bacterium]